MTTPGAPSSEFLSEAQDLVELLSSSLSGVDEALYAGGTPDPDLLFEAYRSVHTLKSLAGMFDVQSVAGLAHELEFALDELRLGRIPLGRAVIDVLLAAGDTFQRVLVELASGRPVLGDLAPLRARIRRLSELEDAEEPEEAGLPGIDPALAGVLTEYQEHRLRASVEQGRRIFAVRASFELLAVDQGIEALKTGAKAFGEVIAFLPLADAPEDHIALDVLLASERPLAEITEGLADLGGVVRELTTGSEPSEPPASPEPSDALLVDPLPSEPEPEMASLRDLTSTVKVDLSRLDHLMNLIGELGVVQTNLGVSFERLRALEGFGELRRTFQGQLRAMARQLSLLQQGLLTVRMVPLEHELERLARAARKLGRELGKEIRPKITGSETELDKLIAEKLSEPLLHMLRNAVDHGIEPPDERVRAGKPPAGMIALRAFQRGNRVVVEMEDDGRGMDWRKIRDTAVRKGLLTPEAAAAIGEAEALDLIYLRGFTTTTEVTTTSGRAMGMDVVRTRVSELSGMIDIDTAPGRGTRFSILLPVTLAIIQALVVDTGGQSFCIPLNAVLESIMVRQSDVATVEGHEVVSLRGRTLPLLHLSRMFGIDGGRGHADPERIYVVIVGLAQQRVGLVVDELLGQRDVVIKPLGSALRAVPGLAGATELGANRTVLLLDVASLVDEALAQDDAAGLGSPGSGLGSPGSGSPASPASVSSAPVSSAPIGSPANRKARLHHGP